MGPLKGQEDGTLRAFFFPAPTFYNTKSLGARSPPTLLSSSRLGLASLLRSPVPISCNRQRHYFLAGNNNSKLR